MAAYNLLVWLQPAIYSVSYQEYLYFSIECQSIAEFSTGLCYQKTFIHLSPVFQTQEGFPNAWTLDGDLSGGQGYSPSGPASCSKVAKRCPLDMHVIGFPNTYPLDSDLSEGYPLDSDLSEGQHNSAFEQPGPVEHLGTEWSDST